ncbi:hypothetical protein SAMN06295888_1104 [Desulfonatronum zhilinae]|nr:hypothetical protein SAMN06295888_1104 [Desulfonatronum zhilinae]
MNKRSEYYFGIAAMTALVCFKMISVFWSYEPI